MTDRHLKHSIEIDVATKKTKFVQKSREGSEEKVRRCCFVVGLTAKSFNGEKATANHVASNEPLLNAFQKTNLTIDESLMLNICGWYLRWF